MPKYFLYIDESKDFKNHTLYLGGLVSRLGLSLFEKFCISSLPVGFPYELKSTKPSDRALFENIISQHSPLYDIYIQKLRAHSDGDYLDKILEYTEIFLREYPEVESLCIYADFTRLSDDMRKVEKSFSKKLSNYCRIPVEIFFKNSHRYRCIQFADLAVGIFRKTQFSPAVDVSQSESKTSLRTTISGPTGKV